MLTTPSSRAAPALSNSFLWRAMISIAVMTTCNAAAAYDDRVDDVMFQDPGFPKVTTRIEFSDRLKPLWLQALARPESELQRMAADTIAMAHRSGRTPSAFGYRCLRCGPGF